MMAESIQNITLTLAEIKGELGVYYGTLDADVPLGAPDNDPSEERAQVLAEAIGYLGDCISLLSDCVIFLSERREDKAAQRDAGEAIQGKEA
jgi:hypothetical protein